MKWFVFALALGGFACSGGSGSVESSGDAAMDVSDAVYWFARNTGDPGTDGSIIVLLSSSGDVCNALENHTFVGHTDILALQVFSGSSDVTPAVGAYPAQENGKRVEAKRATSEGGCEAPAGHLKATAGTLTLTQVPGEDHDDVEGTFEGTLGTPDVNVKATFSASFCDAGADALAGLVRNLKFRTCQ